MLLALSLVVAIESAATPAHAQAKHYICVPCGLPCDAKGFDKPGTCPDCGMALVEQGAQAPPPDTRRKVGILLFNGVEIIDYAGPYELFGAADYNVYTVAETKDAVTTAMGMTVVPRYTFADAPQPDVLVVPGGGVRGAQNDSALLKYVVDVTGKARHTMSVCNGSFILASAGLLDGLTATSTYGNVVRLHANFPRIKVVGDRRVVDNGKIITTAGLSAGMDGALHVISVLDGESQAKNVALMEEYDWHPTGGYMRPVMADRMIPSVDVKKEAGAVGEWSQVSSEGGADHWELVIKGASSLSAPGILSGMGKALEAQAGWSTVSAGSEPASAPGSAPTGTWKFSDIDAKEWRGTLTVQPVPGAERQFTVKLTIARAG